MKYKDIFFDLDRTIWDFEKNSLNCLQDIYEENALINKSVSSFDVFFKIYKNYNKILWDAYRKDEIKKEFLRVERFRLTLQHFHIYDDLLANKLGDDYIDKSPLQTALFPHSIDVLDYLFQKYTLHIITNGFKEVQYVKLQNSKLRKYFKNIFISEEVGVKKPHPKIFEYAVGKSNTKIETSIMIGDDLAVDILGARNVGMDQIYFNPQQKEHSEKITYEIASLDEIMRIL
jgi:putative hydrolase of the HAD superfamily